ncbi:MAG: hypothetical protein EAZ92_15730 [Candidatus Kapaibacterium sp.]|nr:MAG: hypothetical protein EAZ92_15730 [Candidatus Kapabacteria bacterium]
MELRMFKHRLVLSRSSASASAISTAAIFFLSPASAFFLAVFAVFPSFNFAQNAPLGTPQFGSYSFLRNDAGARAAALGGAFVAIHDDPAAVFYNPAVIASADDNQIHATFFKHVADVNSGFFVYNNSLKGLGVSSNSALAQGSVAISANYVNYGQFARTDRNGMSSGATFGGGDLALAATYANQLDSTWFYGVSVKYINSRLDNVSTGAVAVDAGMLYRIPKANVNIGVSVLHAGTQVASLGTMPDRLPIDVRIGVNHRLRGLPLLINASFARLADSTATLPERFLNFQIGGEFYFGQAVRVRIGYDNQRRRELSPEAQPRFTGFNAGVGLALPNLGVDYALSIVGMPGMVHRVSLLLKM